MCEMWFPGYLASAFCSIGFALSLFLASATFTSFLLLVYPRLGFSVHWVAFLQKYTYHRTSVVCSEYTYVASSWQWKYITLLPLRSSCASSLLFFLFQNPKSRRMCSSAPDEHSTNRTTKPLLCLRASFVFLILPLCPFMFFWSWTSTQQSHHHTTQNDYVCSPLLFLHDRDLKSTINTLCKRSLTRLFRALPPLAYQT